MANKRKPRPPLRAIKPNPPGQAPAYELEVEDVPSRDHAALARRAAAGWRIAWLMPEMRNVPTEGSAVAPLQQVWKIFWERPVVIDPGILPESPPATT